MSRWLSRCSEEVNFPNVGHTKTVKFIKLRVSSNKEGDLLATVARQNISGMSVPVIDSVGVSLQTPGSKGIEPSPTLLGDLNCFVPHSSVTVVFTYVQTNRANKERPPCFGTSSQP